MNGGILNKKIIAYGEGSLTGAISLKESILYNQKEFNHIHNLIKNEIA